MAAELQPAIGECPSARDRLIVRGEFPPFAPATLFAYWTTPALLQQWWPREATTEPRPGGEYDFAWPELGWRLRGRYTAFSPGERLAFTWQWDHEAAHHSEVAVTFAPRADGGTTLTLTHGPYTDTPESREERQGHLEGWSHFLTRLHELDPTRERA